MAAIGYICTVALILYFIGLLAFVAWDFISDFDFSEIDFKECTINILIKLLRLDREDNTEREKTNEQTETN